MNELKEQILSVIEKRGKKTCTADMILDALNMHSSMDFIRVSKALEEMEKEYLVFRTDGNGFETREQRGVFEGRISIARNGMGYIDREDREAVRIEPDDQLSAMDGDTVLVACQLWQVYGTVIKILKRARTQVIGTYIPTARGLKFIPDDERLREKQYRVLSDKNFTPVEGLKVLCDIERYDGVMALRVARVIGHKDDPGVDILSILLDHDIVPEFPDDVNEQANSYGSVIKEEDIAGRHDLRSVRTVTIDGDDSKDFDDAVSVEANENGWKLLVSIADVSHYVTENSPLDKEARRRGTSVYVIDRVVPMLPHVLSNGICSLNPKEDRLTLTCAMQVAKDGTIASYELWPSVIRSDERMTYSNVNKILDGDEALRARYAHLGDLFDTLADCADAIRSARLRKGAIEFDSDEAEIKVDENGHPVSVEAKVRGHAEEVIEDCMIAANVCVANQLKWSQIPGIYRIHEEPSSRRIRDFVRISEALGHKLRLGQSNVYPNEIQRYLESVRDTNEFPVLSTLMLRCMQKARYDASCIGHFGLAEEEYLHFTSPIRRYPDLVVHRMLRKYLFEGCTDLAQMKQDEANCSEYAESSSIRERNAQDAEYACEDMKKAEYMLDHIGETYDGLICSVTPHGFYVHLPNTIEGLVQVKELRGDFYIFDKDRMQYIGERSHRIYRVGMPVTVKVLAANPAMHTIDFGLVGHNGSVQKKAPAFIKKREERKRVKKARDITRKGNRHGTKKHKR